MLADAGLVNNQCVLTNRNRLPDLGPGHQERKTNPPLSTGIKITLANA